MLLRLLLILLIAFRLPCNSQVQAYFNMGAFNIPNKQAFIETYLTIAGNSCAKKVSGTSFVHSVNIGFTILKDSTIITANKYNLLSPPFKDTIVDLSFIDNQRYPLPNGNYEAVFTIRDNFAPQQKPLIIRQKFNMSFNDSTLQTSSVQILESYKKSTVPGKLSKSGYDLVPYNINYFPESQNDLSFYLEVYNADSAFGKNKAFLLYYYLEGADNNRKLNSYGSFKKQIASSVNPLLAKMDIKTLGSGNYNLVIEVKDETNTVRLQRKYFFQRLNNAVDIVALYEYAQNKTVSEYFGNVNNADTLKMFVECLWPIASGTDKERIINQAVKKDKDLMKKFVIDFWQRRAADTGNALKMWASYYKNVQQVMVLFKCGKQPGYYTDRGRVYLQYGPPNQRAQQSNDLNTFPYEIWQYYRLHDNVNGQFFSNRKFVFVNKNIADDCHALIRSDTRGEIYNDRWRFDITRRNNNGISNPDNFGPAGTENNQFEDLYNNPR